MCWESALDAEAVTDRMPAADETVSHVFGPTSSVERLCNMFLLPKKPLFVAA